METIKSENLSSSNGLQAQLGDIMRYFQADVQRSLEKLAGTANYRVRNRERHRIANDCCSEGVWFLPFCCRNILIDFEQIF